MTTAQVRLHFVLSLLAISAGVGVAAASPNSTIDPQSSSPPTVPAVSQPNAGGQNGSAPAASPLPEPTAPTSEARKHYEAWLPAGIDNFVPPVQASIECSLPQVVGGAGQRMKELVENLQRFDATENVQHFRVDDLGSRSRRETRAFDYNVNIKLLDSGVFKLDEYRDGHADPSQFPAQIATQGLSAMALILHPIMISDFNFVCEGLGQWNGRPAWQIRFEQRADRPNRLRAYVIAGHPYSVPLKGRVWLDPDTYQVLRLESELMKPLPEIRLAQEHMIINYGPVQFQARKVLWLPLNADVYWERRNRRYYRRHAFSNFRLFGVESGQQVALPKESYCFTNTSGHDIAGTLTVSFIPGVPGKPVSIRFSIPSESKVCKFIGPGKDLNIPPEDVGPATFAHDGHASSLVAEANLANTLELIPESAVTTRQPSEAGSPRGAETISNRPSSVPSRQAGKQAF
jgi:hypothetical protein